MNEDLLPKDRRLGWWILAMNTLAFTVCFAVWMMNGVLVTFLVDNAVYKWDPAQMGWLIGIPVVTGSLFRLPLGMATDRWGGRLVFGLLLLASAVPTYLMCYCDTYLQFCLASLGFGFTGTSFAVGVAYTSAWFPKHRQGTALGIFGAGNAGAALTSLGAPGLLNWLTDQGENLDRWRQLPKIYAALLLATGVLFLATTTTRIVQGTARKSLAERLSPLKVLRVWRFGLYYLFAFGGFVGLAQWLVPYYVSAYGVSVAAAGGLAACTSLPTGLFRAVGGWLSDTLGARTVLYAVFSLSLVFCGLLMVPRMDIFAPGSGVTARFAGVVASVTPTEIAVESPKTGRAAYKVLPKQRELVSPQERAGGMFIFPRSDSWQEPVVKAGDQVVKKQLLARGMTQIFFQANVWIFTALSLILGMLMGIGMAAVYKHIPDYFPHEVGVVGGIVGVIGGLGGFFCPVIFGYLLRASGLWTTCWMFLFVLAAACLLWMHLVVRKMMRSEAPHLMRQFETRPTVEKNAP
ncbi:MAG: NarK/NasA family nitrate transporter [Pirellulales bacterium]|nr:NarK/NasA family nitrate transporter [Pirellulales bacterium]